MAAVFSLVQREGWIGAAAMAAVGWVLYASVGIVWAMPLWVMVPLSLFIFRDPDRQVPPSPLGVVSPADGTVESVQRCEDAFLERDAVRITVRMNRLGSYSTRSPVEGKILRIWSAPRVQEGTPEVGILVQTDEGDDVVIGLRVAGGWSRPRCYVHEGERIGQGQRCGFIRFGASVAVYLPVNSRVEVEAGDRVRAGSVIIAGLVHA
jgi:phosphatidylserine decarboxylase